MSENAVEDFYAQYGRFKEYETPRLGKKQIRRFDRDFWTPTECSVEMAVLEVGCGTGVFLAYLKEKGVGDFLGIDRDEKLRSFIPASAADHFQAEDVIAYLESGAGGRTFDRIVLFDVLEHFTPVDGVGLLKGLSGLLRPKGRILVKVPNMGSPWGAKYQYGDLTHKAAFNPSSMRQLALAAGLRRVTCFPHFEGSPSRRLYDKVFHGLLGRILASPPEIWSANFFALLETGGQE